MNKGRGWMLIILGLALAIGAGALVYYYLSVQQPPPAPPEPIVQTIPVPVASGPLAIGTTISSASYNVVDYPINLVPVDAITDTKQLDSKVLVQPVNQGETFSPDVFLGSTQAALSEQVQPGNVLFAFPIVDLLSKVDVIQDGDRIDLLLTNDVQRGDGQTPIHTTLLTVQNIEVLKVLRPAAQEDGQPVEPTALLLSVRPDDAVMIKYVKDSGGTFDFVLRSKLEDATFQVPPVTTSEFIERYGIGQ